MKQTFTTLFLLFLLLEQTYPKKGVDINQLFQKQFYSCLKGEGFDFAIIVGYINYYAHSDATAGLTNARSAGLQTQIYMVPCRGKAIDAQVNEMINAIDSNLYNRVWIQISNTNQAFGCGWTLYTPMSNCKFVEDLVAQIKSHGKIPAIYSSLTMWQKIFGSRFVCTALKDLELWYAHEDDAQSFSDYIEFGGWKKPSMKQYQEKVFPCGFVANLNYRPQL